MMNLLSTLWESITTTIVIVGTMVAISILYNIWKRQQNEDNDTKVMFIIDKM
jgi:hypothetical protein